MYRRPWILGALVLGVSVCLLAPVASAQELVGGLPKSDVSLELGGKGLLYSFNYQYRPVARLGLEAGVGFFGAGETNDNVTAVFVPVGARLYFLKGKATPFVAGGMTAISAGTDQGPFDNSTVFGHAGPGFEYRSDGGLILRATGYTFFNGEGFFVWPGLALGFAF